jgi:hypothetical protein
MAPPLSPENYVSNVLGLLVAFFVFALLLVIASYVMMSSLPATITPTTDLQILDGYLIGPGLNIENNTQLRLADVEGKNVLGTFSNIPVSPAGTGFISENSILVSSHSAASTNIGNQALTNIEGIPTFTGPTLTSSVMSDLMTSSMIPNLTGFFTFSATAYSIIAYPRWPQNPTRFAFTLQSSQPLPAIGGPMSSGSVEIDIRSFLPPSTTINPTVAPIWSGYVEADQIAGWLTTGTTIQGTVVILDAVLPSPAPIGSQLSFRTDWVVELII